MTKDKPGTYNDGVCQIYAVKNKAPPGGLHQDALVFKIGGLRYSNRMVGVARYYTAKQNNVRADRLIRVPRREEISVRDVCVVGGLQYRIEQVQHPPEVQPPCLDLTLGRLDSDLPLEEAEP